MNGVTTTITSARSYSADGTLNSQTWGNGKVETRTYDLQGRLTQLNVGTDTRRYSYDANGNVTQKVSAPETGNYTYDMLDRLVSDNNGTNTTFGYDANGNRTLLGTTANVYTANTNRLTQAGTTVLMLDAAGNTLTNGTATYSYTNAGQLNQAKNGTTVAGSYVYNALRQRTRKTVGTTTTVFHYNGQGHLIAETKSTGQLIRAYVYADDAPVAQIEPVTVLPPDILLDNTQATFTGTWATATSIAGYYGTNYRTNTKGTGNDKAVWTPSIPNTGTYQVYARWVAASTHASNAPYTIKYNGGSATVTKSQRTSTGQWVLLGSYTFAQGTTGTITLTDKADGTVIADAIKLVATSGGTTQEALRSIHTDHLNTPRLATNASGTIIWRWEGKAFGDTAPNEDPDLDTIKTTINLRYPGQYADAETGLFYNWNRYYEPKMGRYISSDPISLAGGLNTYSYVFSNPLKFFDDTGLLCSYLGREYLSLYSTIKESEIELYRYSFQAPGPRKPRADDCIPSPKPGDKPGRIGIRFPCAIFNFETMLYVVTAGRTDTKKIDVTKYREVYRCTDDCTGKEEIVRLGPFISTKETVIDTDFWVRTRMISANGDGSYDQ